MLQLNDFSGGLNTKSSPRDINVNQLTLADNAIVSKAGLIQSSKDAEDKSSNTDLNHAANHGNGAFLFTSQFDINNTDKLICKRIQSRRLYCQSSQISTKIKS